LTRDHEVCGIVENVALAARRLLFPLHPLLPHLSKLPALLADLLVLQELLARARFLLHPEEGALRRHRMFWITIRMDRVDSLIALSWYLNCTISLATIRLKRFSTR